MLTEQQIQELAANFAEDWFKPHDWTPRITETIKVDLIRRAIEMLEWLSKDYDIVPKEKACGSSKFALAHGERENCLKSRIEENKDILEGKSYPPYLDRPKKIVRPFSHLNLPNMNGLIIDGKVYAAVEQDMQFCCECDLYDKCSSFGAESEKYHGMLLAACLTFGKENIFCYSPTLTDKLNGK